MRGRGKQERMVSLVCKCTPTVNLWISFCSSAFSKIIWLKNTQVHMHTVGKALQKHFKYLLTNFLKISSCSVVNNEELDIRRWLQRNWIKERPFKVGVTCIHSVMKCICLSYLDLKIWMTSLRVFCFCWILGNCFSFKLNIASYWNNWWFWKGRIPFQTNQPNCISFSASVSGVFWREQWVGHQESTETTQQKAALINNKILIFRDFSSMELCYFKRLICQFVKANQHWDGPECLQPCARNTDRAVIQSGPKPSRATGKPLVNTTGLGSVPSRTSCFTLICWHCSLAY